MKKIGAVIIVVFLANTSYCQLLKTDKSSSSVLVNNTSVGFDIGKTELEFSTNNYANKPVDNNIGVLWGVVAKGKNNDGISNVFKAEEFTPSGSLSGHFGFFSSNSEKFKNTYSDAKLKELELEKVSYYNSVKKFFEVEMPNLIKSTDGIVLNSAQQKELNKLLAVPLNSISNKFNKTYIELKKIYENRTIDNQIRLKAEQLVSIIDEKGDIEKLKLINKEQSKIRKRDFDALKSSAKNYQKWNFYGHFGFTGSSFNLFTGWDTLNLNNSFRKETFAGSMGGLGINYANGGDWIFGAKYTYQVSNNLSSLSKTTYKAMSSITSSGQTFTSETSKTAYSGDYSQIYLNRFDVDIIRFIKISDSTTLLLDGFMRVTDSNDEKKYASRTDIGLASLFFKPNGKFMGGLYVTLPDVDQNIERQKENPNYKNWYSRLTFGVYAKFSFTSLVNTLL